MPYRPGNLDQLEPGELRVERTRLQFPELTLCRTRMNLGARLAGNVASSDTVIALAADTSTRARWSGTPFGHADVASSHKKIDLLSRGPSAYYLIAVDRNRFPLEVVVSDPSRANGLRRCLDDLLARPEWTDGEVARRRTGRTLLDLLAMVCDDDAHRRGPIPRRVAAVRRCEEFVHEHVDENPTLAELSAISGLRMRSLINAFRAVTGYSPMAYLKAQRLNGVQRTLRSADHTKTKIIDVAANWGFWHMGHFTADYRTMFGETPSQTLLRQR